MTEAPPQQALPQQTIPQQAIPLPAGSTESRPQQPMAPIIRAAVPGPASRRYLGRQETRESNARSYPRRLPIAVRRAHGPWVEDVDGNVFIDFLAGAGALPLGHGHDEVVEAAVRQLRTYTHGLDLPTPAKDEFTAVHLALLPAGLRDRMKVHFCGPTGANAVEAALKLCKTNTGRSEIISFSGSFHGSTHGAMAVTSLVEQKEPVPGGMPGVHFFPYSYCRRCPLGLNPSTCDTNCVGYLERTMADTHGGVSKPAAVILELVQGEGGVIPATAEFARRVAALARRLDAPLVVDEIQTGYGRTGTWFAFEQYGLEPDVVLASKAVGGIGLPLAVMFYSRHLDTWAPGAHIGTFRGNQPAFAASVAAIRVMRRDGVLANVVDQGDRITRRLRELQRRYPFIGEVRGRGLMIGMEVVDPATDTPDGARAARIQAGALGRGLILEVGGRNDAVVRMLPPLNVTTEVVETALRIVEATLNSVAAEPGRPVAVLPAIAPPRTDHQAAPPVRRQPLATEEDGVLVHEWTAADLRDEPTYGVRAVRLPPLPESLRQPFEGGAWVEVGAGAVMTRHVNPGGESEVFFVVEGSGTVEVDGQRHRVGRGDMIPIPPHQPHSLTADPDGRVLFLSLWWGAAPDGTPSLESDPVGVR